MSVKQQTSFSDDIQPPCRAQCLLCSASGFYRTIPATNPRAVCAAMRRHRDKYHTNYKGKISYKAVKKEAKAYPRQCGRCGGILEHDLDESCHGDGFCVKRFLTRR